MVMIVQGIAVLWFQSFGIHYGFVLHDRLVYRRVYGLVAKIIGTNCAFMGLRIDIVTMGFVWFSCDGIAV